MQVVKFPCMLAFNNGLHVLEGGVCVCVCVCWGDVVTNGGT